MSDRELSALFHKHSEYWIKKSKNSKSMVVESTRLEIALAFKKLHEDLAR